MLLAPLDVLDIPLGHDDVFFRCMTHHPQESHCIVILSVALLFMLLVTVDVLDIPWGHQSGLLQTHDPPFSKNNSFCVTDQHLSASFHCPFLINVQ